MTRITSSGRNASIIAISALALTLGACAHAGSASASQPGIIKIGVSLPITGVDASDGVPAT